MSDRPPGPRQWHPLEFAIDFARHPLALLTRLVRDYGDMAQVRIGGMNVVIVNHPTQIHEVLVEKAGSFTKSPTLKRAKYLLGEGLLTSEGTLHDTQQRLMRPSFRRERLDSYVGVVVQSTHRMMGAWTSGQPRDLSSDMSDLTLGVVGRALFGEDFEAQSEAIKGWYRDALQCLRPFRPHLLANPHLLGWLPLTRSWSFWRAKASLDELVRRIIDKRRQRPLQGDLISSLSGGETPMTEQQVRDEVVTLLLAGHETVAQALTWTWFLLSRHPQVARDIYAEIDRTIGSRDPGPQDLIKLGFTTAVFREAMRLYPPVWVIARQATEPVEIGPYRLPKDTVVAMTQYLVHRDQRWFREPTRFRPHRWLQAGEPDRPKYAYFPFGGGPRHCIGESFAWMEGLTVISVLARGWRFRTLDGWAPNLEPGFTLRAGNGMPMLVCSR